jgi:hypothetical protein
MEKGGCPEHLSEASKAEGEISDKKWRENP